LGLFFPLDFGANELLVVLGFRDSGGMFVELPRLIENKYI
jgi:hypothetical protein